MKTERFDIAVVGGGPGGYAAAFYAADRGKRVVLVEREARLGGVCLLRGCIPSKALLHVAKVRHEAEAATAHGLVFDAPKIDLDRMRAWKESVVDKLSSGLFQLAKRRGVTVWRGRGYFEDSDTLRVEAEGGQRFLQYDKAVIATGSKPALPRLFDLGNPRIMTSTAALDLPEIPEDLLVIGGGYIGMELGTVYAALGSRVTVMEALGSILAEGDADLVRPVAARARLSFKEIRVETRVKRMVTDGRKIRVESEGDGRTFDERFDRVLVAIGRAPNCDDLGLENTRVERDDKGFIKVDDRQQTADPRLIAIGDVAGGALLAHKAAKEARIAIEAATGEASRFHGIVIPAVVFTDPEMAWCGLSESEAREAGRTVRVAKFPWSASGRALTFDRPDGVTKLVVDAETERILGVGVTGAGAGELIGEGVLAIEMGATVRDLAESVHPHPTLSETLMEAAETYFGTATHIAAPMKTRDA